MRIGRIRGVRPCLFRDVAILCILLAIRESGILRMSLPPPTITARWMDVFVGWRSCSGRFFVASWITVIRLGLGARVWTWKLGGKRSVGQFSAWEEPTMSRFTWSTGPLCVVILMG